MRRLFHIAVVLATTALYGGGLAAVAADSLSRTLAFPAPTLTLTPEGLTRVTVPDAVTDAPSGKPALPVCGATFDVPAGFEVAAVTLTPDLVREIPLAAPVEWGLPPHLPTDPATPAVGADPLVYGSDAPYPDLANPVWRADPTGEGTLVSVQVPAVRVSPARGVLLAAETVTVTVSLREKHPADAAPDARRVALVSPLDPGTRTYVVISTSNLLYQTPAPWNFQSLCAARAAAGFTPALVSTEWICQHYAGTNDAAKIRAFVQDAYQNWGLRYLLLGGTYDLVPVQKLYLFFRDIYIDRTTEIPADAIYYGCMDGSFDNNGNGRYGEVTDGVGGGDVDLTAEVMVGRFPVANASELAHMVRKTLRHERATPAEVAPHAFMAEKMNLGTLVYADGFMNELRNGSTAYGLDSLGYKTSPYAALFNADITLYDSDAYIWNTSNALSFLNQNLHTVDHIGHGSTKLCVKISTSNAASMTALRAFTNDMPYFLYSQACNAGGFDTPDCFAEQLVTVSNAAFATVMNAREGWEYGNVVGGHSHRFHRAFWDAAFRGTAACLGEINERSRRANLSLVSPYTPGYWRWVYYELNLFGDPATPFASSVNVTPPTITHEPLINTYDTQAPYRVECAVEPAGIYNPSSIALLWRSSREPGLVHTQALSQTVGNLFEGFIATQPENTRIDYLITARNYAGVETAWPASGETTFFVTERLTLTILGSPFDYGSPDPAYGTHDFASGLVASASAPLLVPLADDTRVANIGFFGTGSVPQSGSQAAASFQIDVSSYLVWLWERQHRLLLTADSGCQPQPTQTLWIAAASTYASPDAPESLTCSNGEAYALAEWRLDGVRAPPLPARSGPAFGDLLMDAPHTLAAHYLPAGFDGDTNGVPDWWEIQYYGTNGQDPQSDEDNDGYTLWEEFLDRANPRSAAVIPAPPAISVTPLDETQTHPGPFTIRATITDSHAVSNAVVRWHRRTESWQETPLVALSNNLFEAQLGDVSAPGDDFEYQLAATDPDGRSTETEVFFFFLIYPVADTSRFHDLSFVALPTQTLASAYMNLHNTGNADLIWSMNVSRVESVMDPALLCWNRTSLGQPWQASTNRFISAPYSLYSRLTSAGTSGSPAVHATIALPPLLIGPRATLSFKYWIYSEIYSSTSSRAFDGGIVEYSKDDGATFQLLRGPYTHTIYGWAYSPWTNGTPCLAGKGEGWRTATFDLAQEYPEENGFEGRSIIFRFHYGGDNNTDKEGWYIDDVTVSPLILQPGFFDDIESGYAFTIPAGGYKRIRWYNLPPSMDTRNDNVTVTLLSNDPVDPITSFYWQIKIRDYPALPGLTASQSADGDGLVWLTSGVADADGEPVSLAAEWSSDSGKHWQAAALTHVSAAIGTAPTNSADGRLADCLTSTNDVRVTNQLSAAWSSRASAPPLDFSTQMLVRVSATNGYFGTTYTTARFTVDNVPPAFGPGALALSPLSTVGPYSITTNLLTFAWPAATDSPAAGPLSYRLTAQANLPPAPGLTNVTALTSATLAFSNRLDTLHDFAVVARDPFGNASAPLTATWLVLDALGDLDRDGLDNASEEIAGTLATDYRDRFMIGLLPVAGKPDLFSLAWDSVAGRLYTVEATPTLAPPAWEPLPGLTDLPGTGAPLAVELPDGRTSLFFRLRVRLP